MAEATDLQGVIVAACCAGCAPEFLPGAPELASGDVMAIIHESHARELQAAGWIRTAADPGTPDDLTCAHYHAAHWRP